MESAEPVWPLVRISLDEIVDSLPVTNDAFLGTYNEVVDHVILPWREPELLPTSVYPSSASVVPRQVASTVCTTRFGPGTVATAAVLLASTRTGAAW